MDESQTLTWRPRELPGVEVVAERGAAYTRRHVRLDTGYAIKITLGGAPPPMRYRGRVHDSAAPGMVTVVEPDEVVYSLGRDATTHRLFSHILVVDAGLMPAGAGRADRPRFRELRYHDRALFDGIAVLHSSLAHGDDRLTLQSTLTGLLDNLVSRHATAPGAVSPVLRPRALRQVRELLHDRLDDNIGLDELASVAGCGKHHLIRSFQHAYGVPPHRYRNLLRLARARSLLAVGRSVAEVAAELGFFDQSHLNRHFRQSYGMSAGAYAKAVR
ncbi:AraC-like DNA-binding protein [Thermocatellispora tengchongensis]|uniref:AraC-like DNA-binding protein n=1 Tax=Thermocatellispora tengchongensis TaxID=1073253 RepID=A0A840PHU5_9ACTN|nr:AraC family transcriptional regulator [Thermocatellispora tengchongensis]MBB5135635.1 AraC-like DNA-binding protein [Thermocatellispora tengchongensis]